MQTVLLQPVEPVVVLLERRHAADAAADDRRRFVPTALGERVAGARDRLAAGDQRQLDVAVEQAQFALGEMILARNGAGATSRSIAVLGEVRKHLADPVSPADSARHNGPTPTPNAETLP